MRRSAAIAVLVTVAAALPAAAKADLRAAVACGDGLASAWRRPVLLIPGTTLTPRVEYAWNWEPALDRLGFPLHHAVHARGRPRGLPGRLCADDRLHRDDDRLRAPPLVRAAIGLLREGELRRALASAAMHRPRVGTR